MNDEHDIDKLFQSAFENFEVSPPDDLKQRIDREIIFATKKSTRKYWFFGSIIALFFLGLFYFLSLPTVKNSKSTLSASKEIPSNTLKEISSNETNSTSKKSPENKLIPTPDTNSKSLKNLGKKSATFNNSTLETTGAQKAIKKPSTKEEKTQDITKNTLQKGKISGGKKKVNSKTKRKKSTKIQKNNSKSTTTFIKETQTNELISEKSNVEIGSTNESLLKAENILPENSNSEKIVENNSAKNEIDSIKREETKLIDSSNSTVINASVLPSKRKLPLLLSLKSGSSLPINNFKYSDLNKVTESSSFNFQFEGLYSFKERANGSSFGVSSGFNYFTRKEEFNNIVQKNESILTGYETIYGQHDSIFQDSSGTTIITIIDSTLVPLYQSIVSEESHKSSYIVQSYSLPFQISFTQKLSDKLYLDLMTGGIVSLQKIKFLDKQNPFNNDLNFNKLGFKVCLKTHLRYQFSHFGVSLSTNFSYDFSAPKIELNTRNRFILDFGIGIHYQF